MSGEVILVTGSSGFLGQHIVKLIQDIDNKCKTIKLMDIVPFANNLGHDKKKEMQEVVADITDYEAMNGAFEGVDCVIHSAADVSVDITTHENKQEIVNVTGTWNVIQACLAHDVKSLIFTSTVDILTGNTDIFNGTEKNTPTLPEGCVFWNYALTKYKAENMVIEANKKTTKMGNTLHTLVLRPTVMYGEQDRFLVYSLLKSGLKQKSKISQVGDGSSITQMTYVGNAAWAHLVAKEKLMTCPGSVSGEIYFITDDTEVKNVFHAMEPFAKSVNLTISDRRIPFWLIYGILTVAEFIMGYVNTLRKEPIAVPSSGGLKYICSSYTFSRTKANLLLNYKPIFNERESISRSNIFYTSCKYD